MKPAKMNPTKKFIHAVFVLNRISEHCEENPESQDVIIRCSDGNIPCNSLFLAAISPMLRGYLSAIETTYHEPLILAPDVRIHDVNTFFRYVHCQLHWYSNQKKIDVNIMKNYFLLEHFFLISGIFVAQKSRSCMTLMTFYPLADFATLFMSQEIFYQKLYENI